jgi:hypothetical protein
MTAVAIIFTKTKFCKDLLHNNSQYQSPIRVNTYLIAPELSELHKKNGQPQRP